MKKLRWGVIGAGGIADRRTIPGMMLAENAELIAVMDINAEQVAAIRRKRTCWQTRRSTPFISPRPSSCTQSRPSWPQITARIS